MLGGYDDTSRSVQSRRNIAKRSESLRRFIQAQYHQHYNKLQSVPLNEWCNRFIQLDTGGYVTKDQVYKQLLQEWPIEGLAYESLLEEYQSSFAPHCVSRPCARQLLRLLRNTGLKTAIITNGETVFQKANIHQLGLSPYINAVLVSEEEGIKKPDPVLFHRGAKRLGILPEECLYVGDHPINDVTGARQAGMKVAWLKQQDSWPLDLPSPEYVLQNLWGLLPLLKELGSQ
ncbi:HAD family hydrolase [Melghirimyces algeriensis]|uniref:Putative hydrolase of the HAD superfamily n=1 Tax=Melghirimyces algeriensis TaxID=910412 RepID=A0A521CEV5_9BACL|nr:HAD family hydrolase [Melghirimyces algeriensis]SMO57963.1 putative hydrolase of the HAD superfamily [Melghirimyces algeriensis]